MAKIIQFPPTPPPPTESEVIATLAADAIGAIGEFREDLQAEVAKLLDTIKAAHMASTQSVPQFDAKVWEEFTEGQRAAICAWSDGVYRHVTATIEYPLMERAITAIAKRLSIRAQVREAGFGFLDVE